MSLKLTPIKVRNLTFGYEEKNPILNDISVTIPRGGFSLLVGPTGCGKSTLLKILPGLYPEFGGKLLSGDVENVPDEWAMIFQDPDKQFTMKTPTEELIFALENLKVKPAEAKARMKEAVALTNTHSLLEQDFNSLSGGEKQRVALAVVIAMKPKLLLLDEPFASCDPGNRKFLIGVLKKMKDDGLTIILTDHHLDGYEPLCDEVFMFEKGGAVKQLNEQERHELFSKVPEVPVFHFALPTEAPAKAYFDSSNFKLQVSKKPLILNDFKLYQGATLLTGENGSGKTSLFKVLTKLLPYKGKIAYLGEDLAKINSKNYFLKVNQVFQNANDQFIMITLQEEIDLSLKHGHNPQMTKDKIASLLQTLGLEHHLDQIVYSLSGGQKKKFQLLLMLIADPDVLLLDEPFAGLDNNSVKVVTKLIQELYLAQGKSLVIVNHQYEASQELCDYHIRLANHQLTYQEN